MYDVTITIPAEVSSATVRAIKSGVNKAIAPATVGRVTTIKNNGPQGLWQARFAIDATEEQLPRALAAERITRIWQEHTGVVAQWLDDLAAINTASLIDAGTSAATAAADAFVGTVDTVGDAFIAVADDVGTAAGGLLEDARTGLGIDLQKLGYVALLVLGLVGGFYVLTRAR